MFRQRNLIASTAQCLNRGFHRTNPKNQTTVTALDWHNERTDLSELQLLDREPEDIDMKAVRRYRLGRVRQEMLRHKIDALVLSDAVNIRYATGTRNMQVFTSRNSPARYALITPDKSILYEFFGCEHLANGFEDTIDEVRTARSAAFIAVGNDIGKVEKEWAKEIMSTIRKMVGQDKVKIGVERINAGTAIELGNLGAEVVDAQQPVEIARSIKSAEELKCVMASLRSTERGVARLRDALRPGMTENQLWSILHQAVIEDDGDYIETRLLNSGDRSNPWFQESSPKVIGANELVALDTDVVGCHGYYADFSRTFHSGPGEPTAQQKEQYRAAHEQVHYNMSIIKPGMSFREYSHTAWPMPEKYWANRYLLSIHGVGMTGEYPYIYHKGDYADFGYDGEFKPGMTLCVESFIGEAGGKEGVKLEEQILVTETGTKLLSNFPFEENMLN